MKDIFKKKQKVIIITIVVVILLILLLLVVKVATSRNEKTNFELSKFYDIYPEDIRKLYTNTLDISCTGVLHLDIELDKGEYKVANLKRIDLVNYVFGYLDKFKAISVGASVEDVIDVSDDLIYGDISLLGDIKNYTYDDYIYTYQKDKITRKSTECKSDIKYVSDINGYFDTEDILSMDINMAYVKDGILYDLSNNRIGDYTEDESELRNLIKGNSYYRYNYVNDGGKYKLYSVEWKSKV